MTIRSNSVITESKVEDQASIGPFALLRPLSEVRTKAKIGNFVEVEESIIGRGSKANHLAYIGDSFLGEEVNYRRWNHYLQLQWIRETSDDHR